MSQFAKPTCVRNGQRKPYTKATRKQIDERIQGAALLLFCGLTKSEIHRAFRLWFGIEWRQADRYMALSRTRRDSRSLGSSGGIIKRSRLRNLLQRSEI